MYQIRKDTYKDVEAVVLENDALTVTITPGVGARTASILYKPQSRELLWQNPDPVHARPGYAAGYEDGEFAGFDEMFPTISKCFYETGPWAGSEMPDHGEVWSLPWDYSIAEDGESVEFTVHGIRFPYRLTKKLSLKEGPAGAARYNVIHTEYTVVNLSANDLDYIWAAHPLFNTHPGMMFIVPEGMNRIINAVPGDPLGVYGRELSFPKAGVADLSRVPEKNSKGYQKYYFSGKVTEGWCILYSPQWELNLGMSYPKDVVSYLGMWLNEGGYADQYNIAPEPATAAMDRVDFSKMWGMNSVLPGGASQSWFLDISLQPGVQAKGMAGAEFVL